MFGNKIEVRKCQVMQCDHSSSEIGCVQLDDCIFIAAAAASLCDIEHVETAFLSLHLSHTDTHSLSPIFLFHSIFPYFAKMRTVISVVVSVKPFISIICSNISLSLCGSVCICISLWQHKNVWTNMFAKRKLTKEKHEIVDYAFVLSCVVYGRAVRIRLWAHVHVLYELWLCVCCCGWNVSVCVCARVLFVSLLADMFCHLFILNMVLLGIQ